MTLLDLHTPIDLGSVDTFCMSPRKATEGAVAPRQVLGKEQEVKGCREDLFFGSHLSPEVGAIKLVITASIFMMQTYSNFI